MYKLRFDNFLLNEDDDDDKAIRRTKMVPMFGPTCI